jgi:general secretion pathway protein G
MQSKGRGFTILELIVVVAIIGLLAGIVVVSMKRALDHARTARAQAEIKEIFYGIILMSSDTLEWPGHQTAWEPCFSCSGNEIQNLNAAIAGLTADDSYTNWKGPYIQDVQVDPWGNHYFFDTDYEVKGDDTPCDGAGGCITVAVLGSYGPDGSGLDLYNADDIILILAR